MKFGDKVIVTNSNLATYNQTGVVESDDNNKIVTVRLYDGGTHTYRKENLKTLYPDSDTGFKENDTVVVANSALHSYGIHGRVIATHSNGQRVKVLLNGTNGKEYTFNSWNLRKTFEVDDVVTSINGDHVGVVTSTKNNSPIVVSVYAGELGDNPRVYMAELSHTGKKFNSKIKLFKQVRVGDSTSVHFNHVGVVTDIDMMTGVVTLEFVGGAKSEFHYTNLITAISEAKRHADVKENDNIVITKNNSPYYGKRGRVMNIIDDTKIRVKLEDGMVIIYNTANVIVSTCQSKPYGYQIGDYVEVIGVCAKLKGKRGKVVAVAEHLNEIWVQVEGVQYPSRYALRNVKLVKQDQDVVNTDVASVDTITATNKSHSAVLFTSVFDDVTAATFTEMFTEPSRFDLERAIVQKMREVGEFYYWVLFLNCKNVNEGKPVPVKITEKLDIR